jgi:TonB family protein
MKKNPFVRLHINPRSESPPLGTIKVAAPCSAEWKWMYGSDRVRFCGQCNQNVYNLSAMTTEEAEDLIRRTDGRLCVRFYRRSDGTIITRNCPVGLQSIRDKLTSTRTHVIAAILSLLGYLGLLGLYKIVDHELAKDSDLVLKSDIKGRHQVSWLRNPLRHPYLDVVTGDVVRPLHLPRRTFASRSETFIRGKAIFKVIPIYHSTGSSQPSGNVVVRVLIDEDGTVDDAESISGITPLRGPAEQAARQWTFEPFVVNGRPARVESTLTFRFNRSNND